MALALPAFWKALHTSLEFVVFPAFIIFSIGLYSVLAEGVFFRENAVLEQYAFMRVALNNIVYLVFSFALYHFFRSVSLDNFSLFKIIFYVGVVNSFVIIFSFLNPEFRNLVESVLYQAPNSNINYQELDWRLRGFASAGGASLSMFNALCVVLGILLVESKRLSPVVFLLGTFLCLASCFVIARTGLMIGGFFFLVWMARNIVLPNPRKFIPIAVCLVGFFYLVMAFIDDFARVIPWALELVINLASGQGATSRSTEHLSTMFDIPDSFINLLFGYGFFEASVSYRSDSGYIKTIYSVGVLLSLVIYFLIFKVLFLGIKNYFQKGSIYWSLFIFFMFIAEIKEPFFYQNYTGRAFVLIAFFVLYSTKYEAKKS